MKGDPKVIELLNQRLSEELTAVSQYMVHAEMCDDWGYGKLAEAVEKRAIDEMKHAEKLIGRILFLEGKPVVSNLQKMFIGDKVEVQIKNDQQSEEGAIKAYNETIKTCTALGDNGTKEMLDSILLDEEAHLDWLDTQLGQIGQMGIQVYLQSKL
jgi:bacterioferritin